MPISLADWQQKQSQQHQHWQRKHFYGSTKSEWITIDGEGWGRDETGRQFYRFMIAANEAGFQMRCLPKERQSLTTDEALEWLASIPHNYRAYCDRVGKEYHEPLIGGFALGYDYSHILIDITETQLTSILANSDYESVPIWITDRFGVKLTAGNLRIYDKETGTELISLWDSYKYYQAAFLKVMGAYATPDQWAIIEAGKSRRDTDAEHDTADEMVYCLNECRVHSRAMNDLSRAVYEMGLKPRGWYGPGSLAASAFSRHRVKDHWKADEEQPAGLHVASRVGYIGGRFETTGHGWLPRMFGHDIRSAYPAGMTKLPCLKHGEWRHVIGSDAMIVMEQTDALAIGLVEWSCDNPAGGWGPYPTRSSRGTDLSGSSVGKLPAWPFNGRSWVWSEEFKAGLFLVSDVSVAEAWVYEQHCRCTPFDWIPYYYDLKSSLREQGNEIGANLAKLILNSGYGKIAQTLGKPPVPTWIWAGLITQSARSQLLRAIQSNPDSCIMVATDAVYSTHPLELDFGNNLGQWDGPDEYGRTLIIQAGFWKDFDSTDPKHQKTRGIARRYLEGDETHYPVWPVFADLWERIARQDYDISDVAVPIRYSDHIGLQRARQYGIEQLGRWTDDAYQDVRFRVDKRPHLIGKPEDGWWKSAPTRTDRIGEQLQLVEVTVGEQYIAEERSAMDRWFIVEQPNAAEWGYDD